MRLQLDRLQPLGRALMLPIAVLPIAGLLLRLGQPDLLDIAFIAAAGDAIFSNLGLLFAIGVAVGLARENHGAAGLAGAIGFLVTVEGAKALLVAPPDVVSAFTDQSARDLAVAAFKHKQLAKLSVPAGILSGLVAGMLYNRFSNITLPEYLAFFGGRRFVPIAAGIAGLLGAILFGLGFPYLEQGINALSRSVVDSGSLGIFIYGVLNRLLIITGLHHILNNIAWFIIGDFNGATGDLKRYFAGDPGAGAFMTGFFPVMMFGLPAACLAMYHTARPERRKATAGMLASLALTSFLTGVTEPIEFSFMFLAPALYALHAVLTGLSMVLMDLLQVRLGFGFSAGLFDYVLSFGLATRPLLLLPVGLAYFAIYYFVFRFCILRFDLKTPGRDLEPVAATGAAASAGDRATRFIQALGGAANFQSIDACTTRLRLRLIDPGLADDAQLKAIGARGLVRPGGDSLQVVLGPIADQVATEIRTALRAPQLPSMSAPLSGDPPQPSRLLQALGGAHNIEQVEVRSTRLIVRTRNDVILDDAAARDLGLRGAARSAGGLLHIIVGPDAERWSAAVRGWAVT
jgi:PTS system N-acetylglucosamine-specific IIC component